MVDVHTVSAGGGSIAWADAGGALRVGPRSAGRRARARRLRARRRGADGHRRQPRCSATCATARSSAARSSCAASCAEQALGALGGELGLDALETALGVVRVANAEMVRALRVISVERGLDPRDFALVAFGGAGGDARLRAGRGARHRARSSSRARAASSARSGLAISDLRRDYVAPPLGDAASLGRDDWRRRSRRSRSSRDRPTPCAGAADLRYRGQSFELTVTADDLDELAERFHERPRAALRLPDGRGAGRARQRCALIATVAVEQARAARGAPPRDEPSGARGAPTSTASGSRPPCCDRDQLGAGAEVAGPAIVEFAEATCVVRPGLGGRDRRRRHARAGARARERERVSLDPVTLSVLSSALAGIAEEMGAVLIRGAYSSNIKERRDCSAALFDADGRMVAQAEHIPVHLGAMPEAVDGGDASATRSRATSSRSTTRTPAAPTCPTSRSSRRMALEGDDRRLTPSTRAHHSDVGGMRPGSMPADSREI